MLPKNLLKEKRKDREEHTQDRRKISEDSKAKVDNLLSDVESYLEASDGDADLIKAVSSLKEAVRESEHIQTGDDRFES